MSHFAIINAESIVTQVIRITQDMVDTGRWGNPNTFIQTSFNMRGGIHYGDDGQPSADQSKTLRKNYAGIGFKYDLVRDAFIPPQVFPSWILNEDTCLWEPPTPMPTDGKPYSWNESTLSWDEIVVPSV